MEPNNTYEREIDLVQLFMAMWKKAWIIIIAAVVGAALISVVKLIPAIKDLNDPEVIEEQEKDYQKELEQYENKKSTLEREIDNITKSIERQKEYNDESILMQINPYDKQIATIQFYVNTGYQIRPDLVYQNPDYSNSIIRSYMSLAQNGEMYNYIIDKLPEKIELRYVKEIIKVDVDYNNNMIFVEVAHKDKEDCENIFQWINDFFTGYQADIAEKVAAHTLDIVSSSEYTAVDLELEQIQRNSEQKVIDLTNSLTTKTDDLDKLEEPKAKISTVGSVIKSAIKYVLVGGVLGGFVAAAVILLLFMMDTTIKTEKDVAFYLGLPILGAIPVIEGKEKEVKAAKSKKKQRLNQYNKTSDQK